MAMPPNSTGDNARWWSAWHLAHGLGKTVEVGFTGYLHTLGVHPFALTFEQLQQHWTNYQALGITPSQGA